MPTPVDVQNFDSTSPGSTPTGWALGSGHAVTNVGAAAKSGTNVLSSTTAASTISYPTAQDSNTGKTSWAFSLKIAGTQAGAGSQYCIMQFRLVSTPSAWSSNTCYALYFVPSNAASNAQIYLVKRISGAETLIGSTILVAPANLPWNAWYDILITADESGSNTTIAIQIQRPNGDYLTSAAAWQSTQAYIINTTSNVAALKANSNVGMLLSMASGATGIYFDSSDYESLASSGTAWSQTCTETLSLTDGRLMAVAKALVETYSLNDARSMGAIKLLGETLALTDGRTMQAGKVGVEAYTLTDLKKFAIGKVAQEALNLTDARMMGAVRKLTEIYGLTDTAAAAIVQAATLIIVSAGPGGLDGITIGNGGIA